MDTRSKGPVIIYRLQGGGEEDLGGDQMVI